MLVREEIQVVGGFRFFLAKELFLVLGYLRGEDHFGLEGARRVFLRGGPVLVLELGEPHRLFFFFQLGGARAWAEALAGQFHFRVVHAISVLEPTQRAVRIVVRSANVRWLDDWARRALPVPVIQFNLLFFPSLNT